MRRTLSMEEKQINVYQAFKKMPDEFIRAFVIPLNAPKKGLFRERLSSTLDRSS